MGCGKRIPAIDGDETLAFGKKRNTVFWQDGELKRIKRKYGKRERKQWRQQVRRALRGDTDEF